jgi:hypothetical protein
MTPLERPNFHEYSRHDPNKGPPQTGSSRRGAKHAWYRGASRDDVDGVESNTEIGDGTPGPPRLSRTRHTPPLAFSRRPVIPHPVFNLAHCSTTLGQRPYFDDTPSKTLQDAPVCVQASGRLRGRPQLTGAHSGTARASRPAGSRS